MTVLDLNQAWTFTFGDEGREEPAIEVNLPHDFIIGRDRSKDAAGGASNGYFANGMGVYTKSLAFEPEWKGKRIRLYIDGAYMNTEVMVNGNSLPIHHHGYTPFLMDITRLLHDGENKLRIQVQSRQPSTRWYSGGGLYRKAELWIGNGFCPWEVQVQTKLLDRAAVIKILAEGDFSATVYDANGQELACGGREIVLSSPHLWEVDDPYLYKLSIRNQGEELCLPIGVREIIFVPQKGMFLNGKPIKLHGGCIHHDNGCLGACAWPDAEERKVRKLKELGYNAIRSSHNPPSQALLDACDRLGMLMMTEAFDVWNEGKKPLDYHLYFRNDWAQDIESMVLSARNHPCVFAYSIGNEILERDGHSEGAQWCERLAHQVKRFDSGRPVLSALNNIWDREFDIFDYLTDMKINPYQKQKFEPDLFGTHTEAFCSHLDLVGYNYLLERYAYDRIHYPNRLIIGTETFAANTYDYWHETMGNPNVIGDFIWTAVDYLGEAGIGRSICSGSKDHSFGGKYPWIHSYDADVDLIGNLRPQGKYRQLLWTKDEAPALYTLPPEKHGIVSGGLGWHFPEYRPAWDYEQSGAVTDVVCFTKAPHVRFLLNGVEVAKAETDECMAKAEIPYEAGTLTAECYDAEGKLLSSCELVTPSEGLHPEVRIEEGNELVFAEVQLKDGKGHPVLNGEHWFRMQVEGGIALASGNANPTPIETNTPTQAKAWQGAALFVILKQDRKSLPKISITLSI